MITSSCFLGKCFFFLLLFCFFLSNLSLPSSSSSLMTSPNASCAYINASSFLSPSRISHFAASLSLNPRISVFAFLGEYPFCIFLTSFRFISANGFNVSPQSYLLNAFCCSALNCSASSGSAYRILLSSSSDIF